MSKKMSVTRDWSGNGSGARSTSFFNGMKRVIRIHSNPCNFLQRHLISSSARTFGQSFCRMLLHKAAPSLSSGSSARRVQSSLSLKDVQCGDAPKGCNHGPSGMWDVPTPRVTDRDYAVAQHRVSDGSWNVRWVLAVSEDVSREDRGCSGRRLVTEQGPLLMLNRQFIRVVHPW